MNKYIGIVVIFLFGLIAILDLLHSGFAATHDGQDHIARIANFYLNLQQGVIIPRWAENLNFGYGHPVLEFLYPLPSYLSSFFHVLGFSLIDSTKLVFGFSMIASGLAMYFFVKKLWGEIPGIVSGVLYMYAPYRFVDLYVRGDIGEHVAFVFIPLSFLGLLLLSKRQTFARFLFTSVSIASLLLAHNAIALMYMPIILCYAIFLYWKNNWERKLGLFLGIGILFGFLLSGFFWIPALFEGQYTLRNIVTKGEYLSRFVSFQQLLYGRWSYGISGMFTVQLGFMHWLALVLITVTTIWKKEKLQREMIFLIILFCSTCAAIFLMLPISNILWEHILLLQNFQFPWRFLAICVFTTSIFGGFVIFQLRGLWKIGITIIILLVMLFLSKDYIHARMYKSLPDSFFNGVYDKTTDTGESSPIWSTRAMLHPVIKPLEIIDGHATITQTKRLTTLHSYTVSASARTLLMENTLYFPGWQILVDGNATPIEFQNQVYRGIMTFFVPTGVHTIMVEYHESKLRLLGDMVSLFGLADLFIVYLLCRKKYL